MAASLFCLALGLGTAFAYTRSLIPSMIAHAIINILETHGYLLIGPCCVEWRLDDTSRMSGDVQVRNL